MRTNAQPKILCACQRRRRAGRFYLCDQGDGSLLWSAEATDNTSYRYVRFEIAVSLRAFSAAGFKVYGSPNDVNLKFVQNLIKVLGN